MARMTVEQKAANRSQQRVRDQAYRARRNAYTAARDAALAESEQTLVSVEYKAADAALDSALQARDAERRRIEAQIAQLKDEIASLDEKHGITKLSAERRSTSDRWLAQRNYVAGKVDAEFADIAGVHSAVEWAAKDNYSPALDIQ